MNERTGGGKTAILSVVCLGIQQVAALVITLFAAGFLTISEYGVYTLAVVFSEFAILLSYTGFFHFIINSEEDDDIVLSTMFWTILGIGVMSGLVMILAAGPLATFFDAPQLKPVLQAFGLIQPAVSIIGWASAALMRAERMRHYFFSVAVSNLIALGIGTTLLALWKSVFALVAFRYARTAFGLVFFCIGLKRPRLIFDRALALEAARYSMGLYGSAILTFFSRFGTDLVLAGVFTTAEAGLYRFANRIAQAAIEIVVQPLRTFALRSMGAVKRAGQTLDVVFAQFLSAGTLSLGVLAATLIVVGPTVVISLFKPDFAAAAVAIQALALRAGARVGQLMVQPVFAARKRTSPAFYFNLAVATAILGSIAVFAPLGLEPLSFAQAIVQILSIPAAIIVIHKWGGVDTRPALHKFGWALALVFLYGIGLFAIWQICASIDVAAHWQLAYAGCLGLLLLTSVMAVAIRLGVFSFGLFAG